MFRGESNWGCSRSPMRGRICQSASSAVWAFCQRRTAMRDVQHVASGLQQRSLQRVFFSCSLGNLVGAGTTIVRGQTAHLLIMSSASTTSRLQQLFASTLCILHCVRCMRCIALIRHGRVERGIDTACRHDHWCLAHILAALPRFADSI